MGEKITRGNERHKVRNVGRNSGKNIRVEGGGGGWRVEEEEEERRGTGATDKVREREKTRETRETERE